MSMKNIIVAVTGASGAIYARQVVGMVLGSGQVGRLALIFTANGAAVSRYEGVEIDTADPRIEVMDNGDMFASTASGSARWDAMVIVPCSMGMVGRLAAGVSDDLISRAADVMLKERRRLVLVPRETPLNTIHLRNMTLLSECGAVILPAAPAFYPHPAGVEELCATVSGRVVALLGLDVTGYEWKKVEIDTV